MVNQITPTFSIEDRQQCFEQLANIVPDVNVSLQSCFEYELKSKIQRRCTSIIIFYFNQAMGIEKLVEDKLHWGPSTYHLGHLPNLINQINLPGLLQNLTQQSLCQKMSLPINKLMIVEMAEKHKGLFYRCAECYHYNQACNVDHNHTWWGQFPLKPLDSCLAEPLLVLKGSGEHSSISYHALTISYLMGFLANVFV